MSVAPPLGKELASVDKKTRDDAVRKLRDFLETTGDKPMSAHEMSKLWKAIFYCFWLSDKPLVQQELASSLAEMLFVTPTPDASLHFLRGFWGAIVREWSGLDYLRIDKYYLLVRKFVNASFRLLIREIWSTTALDEYTSILSGSGGPLNPEDRKIPTSLAYHLADIYNEELNKAMSSSLKCPPVPLAPIFTPFFKLNALSTSPTTHTRFHEALFSPMFAALLVHASPHSVQNYRSTGSTPTLSPREESDSRRRKRVRIEPPEPPLNAICTNARLTAKQAAEETESEEQLTEAPEILPPGEIRKGLLQIMFDIASQEETKEVSRKRMYRAWKDATELAEESEPTSVIQ